MSRPSRVATIHDLPSSGSGGVQKGSYTWGPGQSLSGPPKPASRPETAHEATTHPDQQNGSERPANLSSFGDDNKNCDNTSDSYKNTTNNNITNNTGNKIDNSGEYNFGGGVDCKLTGFTIN